MKTSLQGKIALAVSEGIVDTAYLDNATPPVWTIGIGHTKSAGGINPTDYIGKKLTIEQVFEVFADDLPKYEAIVNRNVKVPLTQNEYDALVHFVYNIGEPNFKKSNLLKNLNAGNKELAFQTGFHGWLKPKSLESRRDKERDIALNGKYGGTVAPLYTADAKGKTIRNGSIDLAKVNLGKAETVVPTPTTTPVAPKPTTGVNTPSVETVSFWTTLIDLIVKLFTRK